MNVCFFNKKSSLLLSKCRDNIPNAKSGLTNCQECLQSSLSCPALIGMEICIPCWFFSRAKLSLPEIAKAAPLYGDLSFLIYVPLDGFASETRVMAPEEKEGSDESRIQRPLAKYPFYNNPKYPYTHKYSFQDNWKINWWGVCWCASVYGVCVWVGVFVVWQFKRIQLALWTFSDKTEAYLSSGVHSSELKMKHEGWIRTFLPRFASCSPAGSFTSAQEGFSGGRLQLGSVFSSTTIKKEWLVRLKATYLSSLHFSSNDKI